MQKDRSASESSVLLVRRNACQRRKRRRSSPHETSAPLLGSSASPMKPGVLLLHCACQRATRAIVTRILLGHTVTCHASDPRVARVTCAARGSNFLTL